MPAPEDATAVAGRFFVVWTDQLVVVSSREGPVASFQADDVAARDLIIVQLAQHTKATEAQLAAAFRVSRPTVSRAKRDYSQAGASALAPVKRGPRGPSKVDRGMETSIARLVREGHAAAAIATRLGISQRSVGRVVDRLGLRAAAPSQDALPLPTGVSARPTGEAAAPESGNASPAASVSKAEPPLTYEPEAANETPSSAAGDTTGSGEPDGEAAAPAPQQASEAGTSSSDADQHEAPAGRDPENRTTDRVLARLGLLMDAVPLFGTRRGVQRAGLLLAVAILVNHRVFADAAKVFSGIGPAFYGLGNSVLALLILFLSRIGRPESLKEHPPRDLGAVMGLDRYPEMKTLRRKIRVLAAQGKSLEFMERLLESHLKRIQGSHLWLYLDGHVSVYSGGKKLKKAHVTRLRTSLPAVLDYWLNDDRGDPLLVITGAAKKTMKMLPEIIADLRKLGEKRPITVAFDREGWSPETFARLDAMEGVYFLTYRKARANKRLPVLPKSAFTRHEWKTYGQSVAYDLADKGIHVDYGPKKKRKRLHLRQITRLTDKGHQTHIVTNDTRTQTVELAHRMFSRWGQENFFKYMSEEMELDGLYTYLMEDADGERLVPNPERKKLGAKLAALEADRERLAAAYGDRALSNAESRRPTMRGFKIANGDLGQRIREIDVALEDLRAQHAALPASVPVKTTLGDNKPKQVHVETRRLLHCFRSAAFRAESALRELIRPNYPRWRQDGRTIVQAMLQTTGDIEASDTELRVYLRPQSSPRRTRTLEVLCEQLNEISARFPGTNLRMWFGVRDHRPVS